tara:strand:+ start:22611 stop:22988 length:378 start_codon:yes stop_codon:yes gene_type:complete
MAYNTEDLYKLAVKAIEEHEPLFIEDLVSFMPCDKTTFYRHFQIDSNEYNALKEKLDSHKVAQKSTLRKNWKDPESAPALQLALYKLLASSDEHKALQMAYTDHTTKGDKLESVTVFKLPDNERD